MVPSEAQAPSYLCLWSRHILFPESIMVAKPVRILAWIVCGLRLASLGWGKVIALGAEKGSPGGDTATGRRSKRVGGRQDYGKNSRRHREEQKGLNKRMMDAAEGERD